MFYKVIKDNKVIDVLDGLVFLKYQKKHGRMQFCDEAEAQAIFSSDRNYIWHVEGLYDLPVFGYDTVMLEKIDEFEYNRLKILNCGTKEDIVDEFVRSIANGDTSLLSDSLKRLYSRQEIDENMVIKICEDYEIAEDNKMSILMLNQ